MRSRSRISATRERLPVDVAVSSFKLLGLKESVYAARRSVPRVAPAWLKSSTIFLLNAERSCGPRLVTRFPSSTTFSSTQFAPALRRSVLSEGHEVSVLPFAAPASINIHGPSQMDDTGFCQSKKLR